MSTVFESIIKGLNEAIESEKGNLKLTRRLVHIEEVPMYTSEDIRNFRSRLNLSRNVFAELLGVSPKTVESWEAGTNIPNRSTRRLLQILDDDIIKKIIIQKNSIAG